MRTTVTLDPDVEAIVKRLMRERRLSFTQAVNFAIRAGASRMHGSFETPTFDMGEARVDLTNALRLAGELEDVGHVRRGVS